jgi:hypothetical protein
MCMAQHLFHLCTIELAIIKSFLHLKLYVTVKSLIELPNVCWIDKLYDLHQEACNIQ